MARLSPCIGICKLDDATGFCLGCGRTGAEIGDWMAMSDAARDDVWSALPARLAALSVRVRLLPIVNEEIVDWIATCVRDRAGTFVIGPPGAVAEFPCEPASDIALDVSGGAVTARRADASLRLRVTEKLRAFAVADGGPIVLGLPRGRAGVPTSTTLAALGPDQDAIDERHTGEQLFDFGVGRRYSRFCLRVGDKQLASELHHQLGKTWSEVLTSSAAHGIFAGSPARVVESASARIEVFSKIPLPGERSPDGAHTHFLPDHLQSGEEISAAIAPPGFAAAVAIFYPKRNSPV
jgi:predicted Fe-S protein YdhL (DUF1289 family)